jgi:tetratricopeptide (TPR) repeat protein
MYAARRQHRHVPFAGHDPKVVGECFAARSLWALGYPDRAIARLEGALTLARELSYAQSLILATDFAVHIHQLRGDAARARAHADAVITLAEEYGQEMWGAFANAHRGWALVQQGEAAEGIDELRRGLAAYDAAGQRYAGRTSLVCWRRRWPVSGASRKG